MLTAAGCAARRARLWALVPESCETLVITTPESLVYLAGFAPSSFVFNSVESAAALILTREHSTLIADNLLGTFLARSHVDEIVALEWYIARKSAPPRRWNLAQALDDRLQGRADGPIGVEAMAHRRSIDGKKVLFLDPILRQLRRAKDPDELALIRRSVQAGEAGHAAALARVRPGMSELDVFLLVQEAAGRALGEPAPLYGDFVSGTRCELERGGPPSSRVIARGDLFLLDYSVVVYGYRADFTNTFVVDAEPSPQQRELERACLSALEIGESLLRPGIECRQLDAAVRGSFRERGLGDYFPSHVGHGLGLGHPEPPYLVPESNDVLAVGDVIALEPGLYVPGRGGMRFEHNYLITGSGYERLTNHHLGLR